MTVVPVGITDSMGRAQEANAVNGRDLHAFLEVGKVFAAWMPEQIESFGFIEHTDYERIDIAPQNRVAICGAKTVYLISISMAKDIKRAPITEGSRQNVEGIYASHSCMMHMPCWLSGVSQLAAGLPGACPGMVWTWRTGAGRTAGNGGMTGGARSTSGSTRGAPVMT